MGPDCYYLQIGQMYVLGCYKVDIIIGVTSKSKAFKEPMFS